MIRSISLPLTLAVVLVSQLALAGCNKKQDVGGTPSTDTAASAPDMSASSSMGATSAPMDSISSASAVSGSAASDAATAASR